MSLDPEVLTLAGSDGKMLAIMPVAPSGGRNMVSLILEGGEGGHFAEDEIVDTLRKFISERL